MAARPRSAWWRVFHLLLIASLLLSVFGPALSPHTLAAPLLQETVDGPAEAETATATPTATASPTPSETPTVTASPTTSETATGTASATPTETTAPSGSPSATPAETASPTVTETATFTPSETATLTTTATLTATATITPTPTLTADEVLVTPEEGGVLHSSDGRVRLLFPASAVSETLRIRYRSGLSRPLAAGEHGLAITFVLEATTADLTAHSVHRFAKPLELCVDLGGLVDCASLAYWQYAYLAYQDEKGTWCELPTLRSGSVLTATVGHFSTLGGGIGNNLNSGWLLAYNGPSVSTFSGGLDYEYPFRIPEGRGGLTPDLKLTYNSRRVDGLLTWVQADWVGLGWSLDSMEIVRKVMPDWSTGSGSPAWCWGYI